MKDLLTEVFVTYWNEDTTDTKEVVYVSTWDAESILEDSTNWLSAQEDGLSLLKEQDGEFDWFEITTIIEK
jgi:hypothetical protein